MSGLDSASFGTALKDRLAAISVADFCVPDARVKALDACNDAAGREAASLIDFETERLSIGN